MTICIPENITHFLNNWSSGDKADEDVLIKKLYPYLHSLVHRQLNNNDFKRLLRTTDVLHDAFIRLRKQKKLEWQNRNHFFAIAAKVIRRVIVDDYRKRMTQKRGVENKIITLDKNLEIVADQSQNLDWLEIDQLLSALANLDQDAADLIELRFFAGLSVPEIAQLRNISVSSIERQWRFAKSWLLNQMQNESWWQ